MSAETVKIHISIQISQEDTVDTGLTIEQWNALHDLERNRIYLEHWNAMAGQDNGGVQVVTEGAEDV